MNATPLKLLVNIIALMLAGLASAVGSVATLQPVASLSLAATNP